MNNDMFADTLTAARARFFEEARGKGATCPCCDRWGKINPYHLNSGMARCLIWLYHWNRKNPRQYCHLPTQADRTVLTSNSTGKLAHWGFTEVDPNKRGAHRITLAGVDFVRDRLKAPEVVWVYNNEVQGRAVKQVGIRDALGDKFDYDAMMGERMDAAATPCQRSSSPGTRSTTPAFGVLRIWKKDREQGEGLYSWLMRITLEAVQGAHKVNGKHRHNGMSLAIKVGEEFPVLMTIMSRGRGKHRGRRR